MRCLYAIKLVKKEDENWVMLSVSMMWGPNDDPWGYPSLITNVEQRSKTNKLFK